MSHLQIKQIIFTIILSCTVKKSPKKTFDNSLKEGHMERTKTRLRTGSVIDSFALYLHQGAWPQPTFKPYNEYRFPKLGDLHRVEQDFFKTSMFDMNKKTQTNTS